MSAQWQLGSAKPGLQQAREVRPVLRCRLKSELGLGCGEQHLERYRHIGHSNALQGRVTHPTGTANEEHGCRRIVPDDRRVMTRTAYESPHRETQRLDGDLQRGNQVRSHRHCSRLLKNCPFEPERTGARDRLGRALQLCQRSRSKLITRVANIKTQFDLRGNHVRRSGSNGELPNGCRETFPSAHRLLNRKHEL